MGDGFKTLLAGKTAGMSTSDRQLFLDFMRQGSLPILVGQAHSILGSMQASNRVLLDKVLNADTPRERLLIWASPLRNARLKRGVDLMNRALKDLDARISRDTSGQASMGFFLRKSVFLLKYRDFLEALMQRYASVEDRGTEMGLMVTSFAETGKFSTGNRDDDAAWNSRIAASDLLEEKYRIYVNGQTVMTSVTCVALATAVVIEIVGAPETGGTSAAAVPATLTALRVASNAVMIGNAGLNLADRYAIAGLKGLENIESLFDVLTLISFAPKLPKAWASSARPLVMTVNTARTISGYALMVGIPSYGLWQVVDAEKISKQTGIPVNTIRLQGISSFALGVMGGMAAYRQQRAYLSRPAAAEVVAELSAPEVTAEPVAEAPAPAPARPPHAPAAKPKPAPEPAKPAHEPAKPAHEPAKPAHEPAKPAPESAPVAAKAPASELSGYATRKITVARRRGTEIVKTESVGLTPEGQADLLVDLEGQVLARRSATSASAEEVRELQNLIRTRGPGWLEQRFALYAKRGATIDQLLSDMAEDLVMEASHVQGLPFAERAARAAGTFRPDNWPRLLAKAGTGLGQFAFTQAKSLFVMGTLLGVWNSFFSPIQRTIFDYAGQQGSRYLGGTAKNLQQWLSALDQTRDANQELKSANNELKKYAFKGLTPTDAKALWAEYERKFLAIAMRAQSTLPQNLRDGRAMFRDYVVNTPLMLGSSLASSELQFSFHKKEYNELKAKIDQGKLTETEAKTSADDLKYHQDMMEVAEGGIASALAAWKITEFLYPEIAREASTDEQRRTFADGFDRFIETMHFSNYVQHFTTQMDQALKQVELNLDQVESDVRAEADQNLNTPAKP